MKSKLFIVVAALVLAAVAYSEPKKSDADALQGKWRGKEKDASVDGPCYMTITGKNFSFLGSDTNEWYKGTFTINEAASPKQFLGTIKECPSSDCVGMTIHAIYSLEAGKFTIAGSPPSETNYPASLDAEGTRKIVFDRRDGEAKTAK